MEMVATPKSSPPFSYLLTQVDTVKMNKRTAIVGGGAAGFFVAVNLKEMMPDMEVTIFESSSRVLKKVGISGGGRCNCTNSFAQVTDLSQVYPRGHRLLKRLFKTFNHRDTYKWFEQHGVKLVTQEDECVFPASQDSHTIINCFLNAAQKQRIEIRTNQRIGKLSELSDYDNIVVTTGGATQINQLQWTEQEVVESVPSLFTFNIEDSALQSLMGTVAEETTVFIPGTKLRASGPLLITHWGMSGPAILRLSSYAARLLASNHYSMPMNVNWVCANEAEVRQELGEIIIRHSQKQIGSVRPFSISSRLWNYLSAKCLGDRADYTWRDLNQKEQNRLTNVLTNDSFQISGRSPFKEEFVTCGGVSLKSVDASTLESKTRHGLYFAGEVLDIDGVTGGFNFQAAWTTAYTVARAIYNKR